MSDGEHDAAVSSALRDERTEDLIATVELDRRRNRVARSSSSTVVELVSKLGDVVFGRRETKCVLLLLIVAGFVSLLSALFNDQSDPEALQRALDYFSEAAVRLASVEQTFVNKTAAVNFSDWN